MINHMLEMEEMTAANNLMNSYKLYFLKALIENVSKNQYYFEFYELASWMCAYSFSDVCVLARRIRPLDKLFDVVVLSIETEGLIQSSSTSEVFTAIRDTNDKQLRNEVLSLCNYVPYRLLAYLWQKELKGKTDSEKNRLIETHSRSEKRSIYAIYSTSQHNKRIEVNSE